MSPLTPREAIEQAMLASLGAAAVTRERAEAVANDFIRRGQITRDEGKAWVDKVTVRVRGEGAPLAGSLGRLEEAVRGVFRATGLATRQELADLELRMAELEHRLARLEGTAGETPAQPASTTD
jgi:polyhydroxyalkanoate synthesis regulator phasin